MENTQKYSVRVLLSGFLSLILIIILLISFIGGPEKNAPKGLISTTLEQSEKDLDEVYRVSLAELKKRVPEPESFHEIEHKSFYLDYRHKDPENYMEVQIEYKTRNNEGGMVIARDFFIYNSAKELTTEGKLH